MASSSSSIEMTPANDNDIQSIQSERDVITSMDSRLYWDAVKGKIDTFKGGTELRLDQILTPSKNSVLHVYITSSETGETNFVEDILEICPDLLMQPNTNNDLPIHVAARYGQERILKILIDRAKALDHHHDDIESGSYVGMAKEMLRKTNKENDTSFHEAARFGHLGVVEIILREEDPAYLYAANGAHESPLYMAAERGYGEVVGEILANCSSVAVGGPNGRTVLHAAVIAKDRGK